MPIPVPNAPLEPDAILHVTPFSGDNYIDSEGISDTEYYTSDILGSTMMLTDKHGQVRERYEYDAFGSLYEGAFVRLSAVGYTGKRYDAKSGRYDYGFREYSTSLGRFTTSDPIRSGANWYVYCMNEPVNFSDYIGLAPTREPNRNLDNSYEEAPYIPRSQIVSEAQKKVGKIPYLEAGLGGLLHPPKDGMKYNNTFLEKDGEIIFYHDIKEDGKVQTYCNQGYYLVALESLGKHSNMLPEYNPKAWYNGQLLTAAGYYDFFIEQEKDNKVTQLSGRSAQLLGDLGYLVTATSYSPWNSHIASVAVSKDPYDPKVGPMLFNSGQVPGYNGIKTTAFAFGSYFDEVKYYSDLKQK